MLVPVRVANGMNVLGRPAGRDVVEYRRLAMSFTTEGTEGTEKKKARCSPSSVTSAPSVV